jgi:hypothetical protein
MFIVAVKTHTWFCTVASFAKKSDAIRFANDIISIGSVQVEDSDSRNDVVFSISPFMNGQEQFNKKIQEKIDAARKDRNAEAVVYYSQKFGASICESFNTYETRPEFDQWVHKYEDDIMRVQLSFVNDIKEKSKKSIAKYTPVALLTAGEADKQKAEQAAQNKAAQDTLPANRPANWMAHCL